MPATINGIGTHYYGAKNRSARVGTCKACGRSATLSSYDTREWFCVIFIPLIPIKKYRILNDCSRCRKHYRIAADEFAQKLAEATAPLRAAIRNSPRDPQPYAALIQTLIGWEMRTDAERELQSALAVFPQNLDLIMLAGQLAVDQNDLQRALTLYERAYRAEPQNEGATYGYGWILHQLEQHEQAAQVLQRASSQERNKAGALYLLGKSQMKLSRWNDALNAFQQLFGVEPAYMNDKQVLGLVAECKRHLGYELNPAERRAGRRWWPFGGKAKRATLQAQPTLVRPSLRYAGLAIVAIMLLGSGFYAWDRWTNLEVYFDNGLDRAVKIEVDGQKFDVALNSLHKEELHSGSHSAVVRGTDGKEIEHLTFSIEKLNPFAAVMHDRFFVYNVGARHVYRRATHGYAQRSEDSSYRSELIGMQRFFEQRDVDFPFQPPPQTISIDSSSSVVMRVSFNVARDIDLRKYALYRLQQGKNDEAQAAIERAVSNAPCDAAARRTQVYFASVTGSFETASKTAHRWIADCSQDDLEAHRAYQDVNREEGRDEALREEYQSLLASSPQSGKAHYLFGRVAGDQQLAIAHYQEAVRLDPKLVWPHVALGHAYQAMERYDDALRELQSALDMEGCDPSVIVYYASAAIAKGQPGEAVETVEHFRKAHAGDLNALHARWLVALASADWEHATQMEKLLTPLETAQIGWWRTTKQMRLKGDAALDARLDSAMRSAALQQAAVEVKIERAIQTGDFAQSADLIAKHTKELDPISTATLEAYTGAGFLLQNDASAAQKLFADAEKQLEAAPKGSAQRLISSVVQGLSGNMPVEQVLETGRRIDTTTHAWFVAAIRAAQAGNRKEASESFAHCARAASDLEFPYLEAKAIAARMR